MLLEKKIIVFSNIKKINNVIIVPFFFNNYFFPKSLYPFFPKFISGSNEIEVIFFDYFKTQEFVAKLKITLSNRIKNLGI